MIQKVLLNRADQELILSVHDGSKADNFENFEGSQGKQWLNFLTKLVKNV